jgi:hypothetical protein
MMSLSQLLPGAGATATNPGPTSGDSSSLYQQEMTELLQLLQEIESMLGGGSQPPSGGSQPPSGGSVPPGLRPGEIQPPPGTTQPGQTTPPTGPNTTTPTPAGSEVFNNLQDANNWHNNTDAAQIGGSGKNLSMKITPGQTMSYDSNMGAYGDTLGSVANKVSSKDNTFTENYSFDPSAKTMPHTQALENDVVATNNQDEQAMFATQFNLKEKAPTGMCWFQTNDNATGKWENAALVPIPKAGQNNDVSITDKMNNNGTFTYGNLSYDGKTYQLANNTFNMKKVNWTKNEVLLQTQEDADANGGPIDETYSNMQLIASET